MVEPIAKWVLILFVLPLLVYRIFFKKSVEARSGQGLFRREEIRDAFVSTVERGQFREVKTRVDQVALADLDAHIEEYLQRDDSFRRSVYRAQSHAVYLDVYEISRTRTRYYEVSLSCPLARDAQEGSEVSPEGSSEVNSEGRPKESTSLPACYLMKRSRENWGRYLLLRPHKTGDSEFDQSYVVLSEDPESSVRALFANDQLRARLERAFDLGYQTIDLQCQGGELAIHKGFDARDWTPSHVEESRDALRAIAAELPLVNVTRDEARPQASQDTTWIVFYVICLIVLGLFDAQVNPFTQTFEALKREITATPVHSLASLIGLVMIYLWGWRYTLKGFKGRHSALVTVIWSVGMITIPVMLHRLVMS